MYNFFDAIKNNLSKECATAIQTFSEMSEKEKDFLISKHSNKNEGFTQKINNIEFIFDKELTNCKNSMVHIKDNDVILNYDINKNKITFIDVELKNKDGEKYLFSFYCQNNVDFAVYGNILGKPLIQYSEKLEFMTQVKDVSYNDIYLIVNNLDKNKNEIIDLIKLFNDKEINKDIITFYEMLSSIKNRFQPSYHSKLVL